MDNGKVEQAIDMVVVGEGEPDIELDEAKKRVPTKARTGMRQWARLEASKTEAKSNLAQIQSQLRDIDTQQAEIGAELEPVLRDFEDQLITVDDIQAQLVHMEQKMGRIKYQKAYERAMEELTRLSGKIAKDVATFADETIGITQQEKDVVKVKMIPPKKPRESVEEAAGSVVRRMVEWFRRTSARTWAGLNAVQGMIDDLEVGGVGQPI